ncbi:sugar ABC transporter permease [Actinospica sp. MGRD01-02]|uniref:Sugar ABC transporter permease n=1 Tax=Actinospica acidithermotolerans TaxID=2828514 RepID=A0A941EC47_9ACTN|nr:sugar ABC transporter permease [Actinospica acidithermotolerans]MBR7827888.1 sugar ABC transporter permease [Actinospica acidithermotolerans]
MAGITGSSLAVATAAHEGPPEAVGAARPGRRRAARRGDGRIASLFLAPALVGFALFYLYPTIRGVYFSFTDYDLLSPPHSVGAANYRYLWRDPLFWNALRVTLQYVVINIVSQTVLALGLAWLMFRLTRSVLVRVLFLVPWLVPNVAVGLLWLWLLDANLGFVNHLITDLGGSSQGFFTTPSLAMPTIAVINTWQYTGYTALLFYAGMLQIPGTLFESARLDGAGEVRTFTRITLPLLRPIMALVLVVSLIGSFQIFDTVSIDPAQGGPVNATRVIYYYIYQLAFTQFRMGYASAVAVTLVLILGVLTFLQLRLLRASRSDLA